MILADLVGQPDLLAKKVHIVNKLPLLLRIRIEMSVLCYAITRHIEALAAIRITSPTASARFLKLRIGSKWMKHLAGARHLCSFASSSKLAG